MTLSDLLDRVTRVPRDPYTRPIPPPGDALRLDGNEGRLPTPDLLRELAGADASLLREYPTTAAVASAIGRRFAVASDRVVVTAGADDALDRCCRAMLEAGRSAVLPEPTFEMLHRFVALTGAEKLTVPWLDRFPTDAVIEALRPDTTLVMMVSPNNPTGATATADDLRAVATAASGALVVLDHAYVEYADEDLTAAALRLENVVVVRTFSKAWGLAGARVGYALAHPDVAAVLREVGNPYPVSALSLAVVRRQLTRGDGDLRDHVARTRAGRDRLTARLRHHGIAVGDSAGNFVFAECGDRAGFVEAALRSQGVVVRRFPHRPHLETGLRISVPASGAQMTRLDEALDLALAPEAVLCDLDGVIADVRGSYDGCIVATAEAFGATVSANEVAAAKRAGDANNDWVVTQRLLASSAIDVPLDEVTARFQELYLGDPIRPGLREREEMLVPRAFLASIAQDRPVGIVTGRPRAEAEWFLDRFALTDLVGVLVAMEDAPLKPNPDPVRLACERLGVRRAWMVGDTPDDVRAAAGAGALPIGVLPPGTDEVATTSALQDAGAAWVIPSLTTLTRFLP